MSSLEEEVAAALARVLDHLENTGEFATSHGVHSDAVEARKVLEKWEVAHEMFATDERANEAADEAERTMQEEHPEWFEPTEGMDMKPEEDG